MKKIVFIINCLTSSIKKKFFKSEKDDISHDCQKAMENLEDIKTIEDFKLIDDYAVRYCATTRWQTL